MLEERSPFHWTQAAMALAALAAFCVAVPAAGDTCPDGDDAALGVAVRVTMDPPAISVDRDSVTIFHQPEPGQPRRVCWTVSGLPSTLRVRFEAKEPAGVDPFPVLIRTLKGKRTFANSGNPTQPTTWRYGLRLIDANGASVAFLDPEVIVKGRGG